MAALITLAPLAVTGQSMSSSVKLQGQASYSRISPPTSGVKLIEDIFQRVRSAPQIAMAKNLYKQQQLELPQQQQRSGPTDYRLAIRPKKSSGRSAAMPSPSLNLMRGDGGMDAISVNFGGAGGASRALIAAEPVTEQWMGARQFPVVARESNAKNSSGVWEIPQQQEFQAGKKSREWDGYMDQPATAARPQQQVMDLKTTAGRLLNLTSKMEQVQRMAEQQIASAPASPSAGVRMNKRSDISEAKFRNNLGEKESKDNSDALMGADEELSQAKLDAAPRQQRRESARAKDKDSGAMRGGGVGDGGSLFSNERMNKAKIAMADIALLPPNVVTGIPLVRLGSSEFQANSALQQIGSMKQQKVNKWTVWSWNRPQGKPGTSLQLYMRNGLLDAMRIFDQTLIGPDFGVTLGDSLARVKEKFGEPAFILQEPGPGAGQNYIYPISQVGFQLARPAPGDQPRVVSLLIFNVK
jgi:hypothetical protein